MDVSQYLEIFIDESKEHLQSMNTCLLELEMQPEDNKDLINEVFRAAHTLKGMSATMGIKNMGVLTHDMENVLTELRNGNMSVSVELLDTLFKCIDALETYVNNIVETGNEGEEAYQNIVDTLNTFLEGETVVDKGVDIVADVSNVVVEDERKHNALILTDFEKNAVIKAEEHNMRAFGITIYLAETCVLKSARAFILFRTLEKIGSIIKSSPSVQDIEDEKFDLDFSVIVLSDDTVDIIEKDLGNISEVTKVLVDVIEVEDAPAEVEVQAQESEKSTASKPKSDKNTESKRDGLAKNANKPVTNHTVRVDIERLDSMMNLVSELIIVKNGLEVVGNNNSNNFAEQIETLARITTNLHDAVMKVRMVPVERVFNRFPRLIRDLSRKLNKQMVLHMSGEDTELDRTVIDEIGDPLVHLIRNAGDHGLEIPEERIANGKDATGNVYLKAYQDGNSVVIEVGDDGRGIDIDKVKNSAIGKGAITVDQADAMTESDIIDLLFRPSFSTVEKLSDVSGRGVGLDVVKTKIEALGGVIDVSTELGKGSTFIIRLPLTMAIIQALMVKLNEEKYAIPLNTIQTIEEIKLEDILYIQNKEVINLRGRVIPIIRLHQKLDVEEIPSDKDSVTVVIVNKGDKQAGLVVDALIGQQENVIKTLGKYLTNIKMIAGATILGDGEVALILDINTIV